MDESSIIDQLRAGAEGIGTEDTDVDALVQGAVVQGRRRRTRRRAGGALAAVVAAAVVVTVVATGVVPTRLGSPQPGPVATPLVATPAISTPAPSPTASPSPRPSEPPTGPATSGVVKSSPEEVRTVAAGLLPGSLTVTASSATRDVGSDGFPWEYTAVLTVHDSLGTSHVLVSIGNGSFGDGCMNLPDCTTSTLPDGGIVWVTGSPEGDKAGPDRTVAYDRADGGHLSLMERNYAEGNGPVTRTGLPLTDAEAKALVTSPAWDRLFQG